MRLHKGFIALIAVFLFIGCGPVVAKDNTYISTCKNDEEVRKRLANLYGEDKQVSPHIDAYCSCKYSVHLKNGISPVEMQKLTDHKYGLEDPQMLKFIGSEWKAIAQCDKAEEINIEKTRCKAEC